MAGNIIAIMTQKGGEGKTSVLTFLATVLHWTVPGLKLAVIDADDGQQNFYAKRQRDLANLEGNSYKKNVYEEMKAATGKDIYPVHLANIEMGEALSLAKELRNENHFVFVDLPGSAKIKGLGDMVLELDYMFVPIYIEENALTSTNIFLEKVSEYFLKDSRCKIKKVVCFFNKYKENQRLRIHKEFQDLREIYKERYDLMEAHIVDSDGVFTTEYKSTIFPLPKPNSKVTVDIYKFAKEFLEKIK